MQLSKERRAEILAEAREAGEGDEYTSQQLNESAQLFFDEVVTREEVETLTDEERDELQDAVIEEYNEGFMFRPVIDYNKRLTAVMEEIAEGTNWDNWEADEETGKEWKTAEVLHCKLEHIRDYFNKFDESERGEWDDTLDDVQKILKAIADSESTDYNKN